MNTVEVEVRLPHSTLKEKDVVEATYSVRDKEVNIVKVVNKHTGEDLDVAHLFADSIRVYEDIYDACRQDEYERRLDGEESRRDR